MPRCTGFILGNTVGLMPGLMTGQSIMGIRLLICEKISPKLRSGAKVDILDPFQRSVFEYSRNPTIRIHLENQLRQDRNPRSTVRFSILPSAWGLTLSDLSLATAEYIPIEPQYIHACASLP
jgi:hypothetical protein